MTDGERSPVIAVENPEGSGPFVILCDHASNRIPQQFESSGFDSALLDTHIAWDPGALGVACHLSKALDAPLVWPDASRLLIDCNRPLDASSLIAIETERGPVEANRDLSWEERSRRIATIHAPYHGAIDACLRRRAAEGLGTALVAIHSFTPIFFGRPRPWQIGIVFGDDRRLADVIIRELKSDPALTVGVNEPYAPADNVYYTVERHSAPGRLPAAMVEIRNDEIGEESGQRRWGDQLTPILLAANRTLAGASHVAV
jgi:predicted N-formylglutamate amidohydrolase